MLGADLGNTKEGIATVALKAGADSAADLAAGDMAVDIVLKYHHWPMMMRTIGPRGEGVKRGTPVGTA